MAVGPMQKFTSRQSPAGFRHQRTAPRRTRWEMSRVLMWFGFLVTVLSSSGMNVVHAQSLEGIKPLLKPPVAVRGSDLLIPLGNQGARIRWPETMEARIGGSVVDVTVAWMEPDFSALKNWVTPAEPIKVVSGADRPQERSEGRPLGIVPIPEDATGPIDFLGETWSMSYLPSPPPLDGPELGPLARDIAPSRTDPFEYFRWVLIAENRKASPPPPGGSDLSQRIAQAVAHEWRAGLARIAVESPGVAAEIRERLIATVKDDLRPDTDEQVAAWLTGARPLTMLRTLMIDPERSDEEAMRASLSWLDSQPDFHAWFEATAGDRTRLGVINPTFDEIVISAVWQGSDDAPVGLVVPPQSLVRHVVTRPVLPGNAVVPANEQLVLSSEDRVTLRLDAGPRSVPVRPPGIEFKPMLLPLTLAEICGGFRDAPVSSQSTAAMLRRRFGRWEIFVDCFHLRADNDDRLLIQVGDPNRSAAVLEVNSTGSWRVRRGRVEPGLDIKVQSFIDRWRCQVVLPEAWLINAITSDSGGAVLLGLRRDGPGDIRQFAVLATPAFNSDIAGVAFDLAAWGEARNEYP